MLKVQLLGGGVGWSKDQLFRGGVGGSRGQFLTVQPGGVVLLRADHTAVAKATEEGGVPAHEVRGDAGVQLAIWNQNGGHHSLRY